MRLIQPMFSPSPFSVVWPPRLGTRSALLLLTLLPAAWATPAAAPPTPASISFGGPNMQRLAADSYRLAGLGGTFDEWLASAYQKAGVPLGGALGGATTNRHLMADLKARRTALLAADPAQRDQLARETGVWAHRFIKKAIPRFSLERGFEFASVARTGERQCLLQSVLIAGLLQRTGLQAGLEMVWKSQSGQESNLGHVTGVLRLPSGAGDVMVDASEPDPTARHQGVLAWAEGQYRFLLPVYTPQDRITAYRWAGGAAQFKPSQVTFLSLTYVRSQFDYYRAERAPGGILGTGTGRATLGGLKLSEARLQSALSAEPNNALAAGVLGNVWRKQGRVAEAKAQYLRAGALYQAQGHVPAGVQANLAWASAK